MPLVKYHTPEEKAEARIRNTKNYYEKNKERIKAYNRGRHVPTGNPVGRPSTNNIDQTPAAIDAN